jgi:hypothetical protein
MRIHAAGFMNLFSPQKKGNPARDRPGPVDCPAQCESPQWCRNNLVFSNTLLLDGSNMILSITVLGQEYTFIDSTRQYLDMIDLFTPLDLV